MSLFISTLVMSHLLFVCGFHQQMNVKFQNQMDAIRSSIALRQLFSQWAMVPKKMDIFYVKNTQVFIKSKLDGIEIVRQLKNHKSFRVSHCQTKFEDMSVLVWNEKVKIEQKIFACHGQELTLEKSLSYALKPPFYVMIFYPIHLSIEGKRLYLNSHDNKQVLLSGFEYLKISLDNDLHIELKWPNLPKMRWKI